MTTRYTDYLQKYQSGEIDLADMYYNVKLVVEDYEPFEEHKPIDVEKYLITGLGVLKQDDILHDSMGDILNKAKTYLKIGIEMFPELVAEQVDSVLTDPEKREKLKELIRMPPTDEYGQHSYWEKMKECGVKWFVFESAPHDILCFAEEIQ
jgi:hypothetical protein